MARMSNWWRAYEEAVDDPKLLLLPSDRHRWGWFCLMCLASVDGGVLPHIDVVALKLRTTKVKAAELITVLVRAGLIDHLGNGTFAPHNWSARQYKSDVTDPTNAERQKRYRDRRKVTDSAVTPTVTESVTDKRPETETETEKNSEPNGSGAEAPAEVVTDPGQPAYTDDRHELWGEGVAILAQLGVPERSARSNIGRWLKDTGDNCRAVLDAIQRARDHRASSPIPWITNGLRTTNGARTHHPNRPDTTEDPILAGMGRLAARLVAKNQPARPGDGEVPGGLDLAGGAGPRLLGASRA